MSSSTRLSHELVEAARDSIGGMEFICIATVPSILTGEPTTQSLHAAELMLTD
jgi:hypothetical protein